MTKEEAIIDIRENIQPIIGVLAMQGIRNFIEEEVNKNE